MVIFKEYIIIAMSASIMIGLAESLVKESTKPFVRFISGLFLIVLLAFPVLDAVADFTGELYTALSADYSGETVEGDISEGIVRSFRNTLEDSVRDHVCALTGFDSTLVQVDCVIDSSDPESINVSNITVRLYRDHDKDIIRRSVEKSYGADTEVIIIDR